MDSRRRPLPSVFGAQFLCSPPEQVPARTGLRLQENIEAKHVRQIECGRTYDIRIYAAAASAAAESGLNSEASFHPDWDKQVYLCVVPCKDPWVIYHWRRETLCTTLGDMFKALGPNHSAREIYYFYRSRKIVARKMMKHCRRILASCSLR